MVKCLHFQVQYRLNVDNSGRWECIECGQLFQPIISSTAFIDACAAQQKAIAEQEEERKKGNMPAYPTHPDNCIDSVHGHFTRGDTGISILEYFAAKALQGMLANPDVGYPMAEICREAYSYAEQMIYERGKR